MSSDNLDYTKQAIRNRVEKSMDEGGFIDAVALCDWESALNRADAFHFANFTEIMLWRLNTLPRTPRGEIIMSTYEIEYRYNHLGNIETEFDHDIEAETPFMALAMFMERTSGHEAEFINDDPEKLQDWLDTLMEEGDVSFDTDDLRPASFNREDTTIGRLLTWMVEADPRAENICWWGWDGCSEQFAPKAIYEQKSIVCPVCHGEGRIVPGQNMEVK